MDFFDIAEYWIENVVFAPIEWATRAMEMVEDKAGPFAAFVVLAVLTVPIMMGLFVTVMLTALLIIAVVLTCPLSLPIAVWLHRRNR